MRSRELKHFLQLVRKQNFEANGGNSSQFGHSWLYIHYALLSEQMFAFYFVASGSAPVSLSFFSHLTTLFYSAQVEADLGYTNGKGHDFPLG